MSSTPSVDSLPGPGFRPNGAYVYNSVQIGSHSSSGSTEEVVCVNNNSSVATCQMCVSAASEVKVSSDIIVEAAICGHGLCPRTRGRCVSTGDGIGEEIGAEGELEAELTFAESIQPRVWQHTALLRRRASSEVGAYGKRGKAPKGVLQCRRRNRGGRHVGDDSEETRRWDTALPSISPDDSTSADMRVAREVLASKSTLLSHPPSQRLQWGVWRHLAVMEIDLAVGRAAFLRTSAQAAPGVWMGSAMARLRRQTRQEWRDALATSPGQAETAFCELGLRCAVTRFASQQVGRSKRKANPVEWASGTTVPSTGVGSAEEDSAAQPRRSPPGAETPGHENIITACRRQELLRRAAKLAQCHIVGIRTEGDLRICTLNVNGLFADKFMQILSFIAEFKIDVVICIDTRISLTAAKSFGIVAKQSLGLGTWTGACDFGRPRPTHKRRATQAAGGQLIIVSPRYGGAVRDFRQDWTGLGIASSFTLPCAAGRLMVVGSYWPTPGSKTEGSNKLSDRLRQELVARGHQENPMVMIKDMIGRWWDKHMSVAGNSFILAGDLNSGWGGSTGTYAGLKAWADDLDLVNGPWELSTDAGIALLTRPPSPANARGSMVDHILLASPDQGIVTSGAWIPTGADWAVISDHLPLVAEFSIKGGRGSDCLVLPGVSIPSEPGVDLDLSDIRACKRFHTALEKLAASESFVELAAADPCAALEQASLASSKTARKVQRKKKKGSGKRKDGWSPLFLAYKQHLLMLLEVRRHMWGQARRSLWGPGRDCSLDIARLTEVWEASVAGILWDSSISDAFNQDNIQAVLNVTGMGPERWRLFTGNRQQLVICEMDRVRSLMQGRRRTEMRRSINDNVRKREDLRAQGKIGKVIRSILGTQREFFGMDSVRTLSGDVLTDAVDIHATMTAHFTEVYTTLEEYKGLFLHTGREDWLALSNSKQLFRAKVQSMQKGIPDRMIDAIWEGLVDVPKEEALRAKLATVLTTTPTREEFGDSLRSIKRGSSPGMSGLSYNMISQWPELMVDVVYACLVRIWETKAVPDFWKWKWLVPIPKDPDDVSLSTLRPIMLIETTRKLWGRLIMRKIQTVWTEMETLSKAQHGGLPERGTDTANVQHINIMESAMATLAALHLSSWDMQKAFDAVSRNAMVLGWERLGVPRDVAEWIGGMDDDGRVVVRTPAAASINNNNKNSVC